MVVRPDSNDVPTQSAGHQSHATDLMLNQSMSAVDVGDVSEGRFEAELGAVSTLMSEELPLDRRPSVPPGALTALAALRDVCARIDQRLARAEDVSGRRDGSAIDHALHEVCAQIYDRLARVEDALRRTEGYVADKPWDVSTIAYKRLERVEETLRLTQQSLADSTLPEMCVHIERELIRTREALQRSEEGMADNGLRERCESIEARLVRTESALRRNEDLVAEWLQELSADMTARFADAEGAMQRIEQIVSAKTAAQPTPQQPFVQTDTRPVQAHTRSVRPGLSLHRFLGVIGTNGVVRLPSMARLVVPVLALAAAFVTGAMMSTGPGSARETAVPQAPAGETATRVASVATEAAAPRTPGPVPESRISPTTQRSSDRESTPIATRPATFAGTLSIKSVPAGAQVTINGKVAGATPLTLPRQRAGSHAVQIAQDGFERWSAAVRVPADQLTQVTATLRPIAR